MERRYDSATHKAPPDRLEVRLRALAVGPRNVVQLGKPGDRWLVAERAVWSVMVVVPDPSVKGGDAVGAGGVDGAAIGPAAKHRADKALGLAVGAWPVGPRAQVLEAERSAGQGVHGRAIASAVVAHHALDGDAVTGVKSDRAPEKPGRCGRLLVGEDLDVGQARGVVDADVYVLPARLQASNARRVAPAWAPVA